MTNNIEDATCIIKLDCPFYRKDMYNKGEMEFYTDCCLRGGEGCGMKRNYDLSERVRDNLERTVNDKYPQDK